MELVCGSQNYEWGKPGKESIVAKLLKSSDPRTKMDLSLPYAELWMGCHPNMPSKIKKSKQALQDFIQKKPQVLGNKVIEQFGNQLPFLFKVLSIKKALSIQAHPSKKLAEELHAKQPDIYKDPNYKPEMAVAITPLEALCGFRPICEIKSYLKAVPELQKLTVDIQAEDDFQLIKNALRSVLQTPKDEIEQAVNTLVDRVSKIQNEDQQRFENVELIQRLNNQFPGDVGLFMVYFLNYLKVDEGQAIFLAECEPHAYISGDCVECMACSDNVVRAGLTPKLIDVDTLISMLKYRSTSPAENFLQPEIEDEFTSVFKPPVPDFALVHIKIPELTTAHSLRKRSTASILIVISGKGKSKNIDLVPGRVLFLAAEEEIMIDAVDSMEIYQAFVNV